MARTPSNMLALGTIAPDFALPDTVSGETLSLQALRGEQATVVMFICNHCPFVIHVLDTVVAIAKAYQRQGVSFIAISSNDAANYLADAPDKMTEKAMSMGFTFPYLYDQTQAVAKAYEAACTPDFYVFDSQLACVYRGQMDGARPGNDVPVTGIDLTNALDAIIKGEPVNPEQKPSLGCNIKWLK